MSAGRLKVYDRSKYSWLLLKTQSYLPARHSRIFGLNGIITLSVVSMENSLAIKLGVFSKFLSFFQLHVLSYFPKQTLCSRKTNSFAISKYLYPETSKTFSREQRTSSRRKSLQGNGSSYLIKE